MSNKNPLIRIVAGALVISSFGMCTKTVNKIDKSTVTVPDTSITAGANSLAAAAFTYTVQPSQWMVDGTKFPAGTIVYIPAGKRGALLLKNFKGTAASPIVVVNKGGKVTFSATSSASYAFKTQNCQFFKILGNGSANAKYGLDVNGGNISMTMDDLSSDFEIANVEVRNSGFAGIMAKTDPSCNSATWRGHFTLKNVAIHDNYVHKTGGEGLYIGNSFYASGVSLSCGTVLPHDVVNLKVYRNLVDSTGCEGIQVGCAISGCLIYNNIVKMPGLTPFATGQNNGIQLGEGTGGRCYSNLVENAPGNGIIVLGLGDNLVFNNFILNSKGYGIFADSRYTPGPHFQFINNTLVGSVLGGVKLDSETIPMNIVVNNVIIQPGTSQPIIKKSNLVKITAIKNYTGKDVNALKYVNYNAENFHLQPTSPLINAGNNALPYGVNFDFYGKLRPDASIFDIGATEY